MNATGPGVRKTGAEHFSPLASVQTRPGSIPPCKKCGQPSLGAQVNEMLPGARSGSPVMQVTFFCHDCHDGPFTVMSCALDPHYDVTPLSSGDYLLRRYDREAAIARVTARSRR